MARKAPKQPAERPPVGITRRPPVAAIAGSSGIAGPRRARLLVLLSRGPQFALEPDPNRNILLITIDTLRADALSAYGGRAATPNLDALANRGARFQFAHAHAVVTLPSHTSILTGRLPYEHGMRDNSGFRVQDGTETLATRLRPRASRPARSSRASRSPSASASRRASTSTTTSCPKWERATAHSMPDRPADVVVSRTRSTGSASSPERSSPGCTCSIRTRRTSRRSDLRAQYADQPYFGEVAFVDRALGPLFERLRALDRPTLVIVTADHGESLGDHGELTHGMFAYEATLRVPLIMAVVGGKGGGRRRAAR